MSHGKHTVPQDTPPAR